MAIVLEGAAMTDRMAVHNHLVERLALPTYYGRNLDALNDVHMELGGETEIIFRDPGAVAEQLGRYGEALLDTLREAAESNPNLTVTLK